MANILYKTDYYTNVYLLYLDDVPISEVMEVLGTAAGDPSPLYEAAQQERQAETERGSTLATATSPVRTDAPRTNDARAGYGGR
jgi:hypothetical protein